MAFQYLFAGIPVAELEPALAWYQRLFGRPPDVVPNDTEAMWEVTESGWIYVVADSARAGRGLATVLVDDLQGELAMMAERGIVTAAVETAPGIYRKAIFEDPEGNRIQFGQTLGDGAERDRM